MTIIEELGGYERASSIAKCTSGVVHPTKQLLDALLEYRRENNIFEVGDSVVLLKFQHMWHDMKSLYVVESLEVYDGVTIGISIRNKNTSLGGEIRNIRHATPKKSKQGIDYEDN